ncbi:MAG: YdeI/OmpD-associated family protein, partial [Ktedonobacteraceae bacterium]
IWSKVNCDKATALIAEGRMQPAGIRQVELAKADGRWESAYESQSKITIPADFQSELDKNQKAKDFFSALDSINRYAILFRIHSAKKPATRSARINKFIEMLSNNQKIYS